MSEPTDRARRRATIGLVLFSVYLVVYVVFVAISAFSWSALGAVRIAGVNLAIVYGFGLIFLALVLALVYDRMCRSVDAS